MLKEVVVTGVERFFDEDEIIVSKTNLQGHLTYCNDVFLSIAGYTEKECLGQPHSMIRHPDMPRAVFALLWETIQQGNEIFAYVINRCKNGDHYWVQAHVTPSRDLSGQIIGYHSNRRVPDRAVLNEHIVPLYAELQKIEQQPGNKKNAMQSAISRLQEILDDQGMEYDEFIAKLAA